MEADFDQLAERVGKPSGLHIDGTGSTRVPGDERFEPVVHWLFGAGDPSDYEGPPTIGATQLGRTAKCPVRSDVGHAGFGSQPGDERFGRANRRRVVD